jgi:uncharacterized protein YjdB
VRASARLALCAALVLSAACAKKPKEIRIAPAKATIYGTKKSILLTGDVLDKEGQPIPGLVVAWTSAKPTIASVEKTGTVKSVSAGKVAITARLDTLSANAIIEVVDVGGITMTPVRMTLAGPKSTKSAVQVEVKDSKGKPLALKTSFASSNPRVVTIDNAGVLTSVGEGKTTVTATLGDFAAASDVAVTFRDIASFELAPLTVILKTGESQVLRATARDAQGNAIEDAAVIWSSSEPGTASVYNGMVTGKVPGSSTVKAICGPKSAEVSVLVN